MSRKHIFTVAIALFCLFAFKQANAQYFHFSKSNSLPTSSCDTGLYFMYEQVWIDGNDTTIKGVIEGSWGLVGPIHPDSLLFTIDYGDGTIEQGNTVKNQSFISHIIGEHVYSNYGSYNVSVTTETYINGLVCTATRNLTMNFPYYDISNIDVVRISEDRYNLYAEVGPTDQYTYIVAYDDWNAQSFPMTITSTPSNTALIEVEYTRRFSNIHYGDTIKQELHVSDGPTGAGLGSHIKYYFNFVHDSLICLADFGYSTNVLTATFGDSSLGPDVNNWYWDFGDGTIDSVQNPVHTYASFGTYNVCLVTQEVDTATNTVVCSDTICKTVNMTGTPVVNSDLTANIYQPHIDILWDYKTWEFENKATTNWAGGQVTYDWDFGDGNTLTDTTGDNQIYTYADTGTYNICLTINHYYNSVLLSSDTYCETITIYDLELYSFTTTRLSEFTYQFDAKLSPLFVPPGNYEINGGAPSGTGFFSNPETYVFTFNSYGNQIVYFHDVAIIGSDAFIVETIDTVNIVPLTDTINAGFSTVNTLLTVGFTDTSVATSPITDWYWDFGDGNTSTLQHPSHAYAAAGTYTVSLIAGIKDVNGVSIAINDTAIQQITINTPTVCNSNFGVYANGLAVHLTDSSSANTTDWYWDFGDGNTDSTQNPSYTYASVGIKTITLITKEKDVIGNVLCIDTISTQVTLSNPLICHAVFYALGDTNSTSNAINIQFYDASPGGGNWHWDFGDGDTSVLANPSHTYTTEGWYTVCLRIENGTCMDTICDSIYVDTNFSVHAAFNYSKLGGNQVQFTNGSTQRANMRYYWDFGDGNTSTQMAPSHTYAVGGNYTVCLIATDIATNVSDIYCDTQVDPTSDIGIEEEVLARISLYPNPVRDLLKIKGLGIHKVRVYSYTGILIAETRETEIDMSAYQRGMYIIQIELNNQQLQSFRVVKVD